MGVQLMCLDRRSLRCVRQPLEVEQQPYIVVGGVYRSQLCKR